MDEMIKEEIIDDLKDELIDAMERFSKLAKLSKEALGPYKDHEGTCGIQCEACRLRGYYYQVDSMVMEI